MKVGVVAVVAFAMFINQTTPSHPIKPTKPLLDDLGYLRANFGEKKGSREGDFEWVAFTNALGGRTDAYFPFGLADRRYYITNDHYFNYQTKEDGRVIRHWSVELETSKDVKGTKEERGTLEAMLANRGLRVKGKVPKRVLYSLKARKPFAGYWHKDMDQGEFWFVSEDGVESKHLWDDSGTGRDVNGNPVSCSYSVTNEEMFWFRVHSMDPH